MAVEFPHLFSSTFDGWVKKNAERNKNCTPGNRSMKTGMKKNAIISSVNDMTNIRQCISRFHFSSDQFVCVCVCLRLFSLRCASHSSLKLLAVLYSLHCSSWPIHQPTLDTLLLFVMERHVCVYTLVDTRQWKNDIELWKIAQNAVLTQIIHYLCMPLNENGKEW